MITEEKQLLMLITNPYDFPYTEIQKKQIKRIQLFLDMLELQQKVDYPNM